MEINKNFTLHSSSSSPTFEGKRGLDKRVTAIVERRDGW